VGSDTMEDTICAISTAPGIGAISIIRLSGKEAIKIANSIFKGQDLTKVPSHTINYGFICDVNNKIDEVMVSVMKAPKTYTKEDIVEINSHGGLITTNKILELLLEKGCRLAEPGEFTKRAFLNGRIDLIEAESVNDLIYAKNEAARKLALNSMGGKLTELLNKIRHSIMDVIANIEVNIDYPEYEDVEVVTKDSLLPKLNDIKDRINEILINSKNGKIIKDGINVAIVGKPNVGKSSLLNVFLDEERAIVTDIAGTTRDTVEGSITLNGFLINIIDTAGIRQTEDVVEKIGVEKSLYTISYADLVIIVLNNNDELSSYEKELIDSVPEEKRIIFVNKDDLESNMNIDYKHLKGNTLSIAGINNLKEEIISRFNLNQIIQKDMTYMSNIRQIDLLKKALDSINSAINNLEKGMPIDIVEIDIKNAWNYLGEITGEVYQDELLNNLFSNFCIGK
jgi:tRNA modification GTPase